MPTELSRLARRVEDGFEHVNDRIDGLYVLLGSKPPPPEEHSPEPKSRWERRIQAAATMLLALGAFLTPILVVVLSK